MKSTKIMIITNDTTSVYRCRHELIECLILKGYSISIVGKILGFSKELGEIGCNLLEADYNRHSKNPLHDIRLFLLYLGIVQKEKPDIILTYNIKPNVYGGMAAYVSKIPYIMNITGLGSAIERGGILRYIALILYRCTAYKASCVFFQNRSNIEELNIKKNVHIRYHLIPGSGVNLNEYLYEEYPEEKSDLVILFLGRIMKDKGIEELLAAAIKIKKKYPKIKFFVAGICEEDYSKQLDHLTKEGVISYLGVYENVKPLLKECSAIVLPSYHEGMSNVLLEASASGRPVLASNIPGCVESFDEGATGLGFEPKNVESLEYVLEKFILLPYESRKRMGIDARKKMEREFNRNMVVNAYLEEIEKIQMEGKKRESI